VAELMWLYMTGTVYILFGAPLDFEWFGSSAGLCAVCLGVRGTHFVFVAASDALSSAARRRFFD